MNIKIITLHRVFNYGSVLQTYATEKMFEKHGHKVEIIDYITEIRTLKKQFKITPPTLRQDMLHRSIYFFCKYFSLILKKRTFWRFLKKNVNLTRRKYITYNDLVENPPIADVYITGSDQVWNSKYNNGIDRGFYLDFTDSPNKFAFAASFGMEQIPENELEETKRLLKKYKSITVREDEANVLLDKMKIDNHFVIIDPTLQLRKNDWLKLASKRLIKEKYVLLMLLYNEDNNATEYARKIADKMNAKLVKISWEMKKPDKVDILFTHRNPKDFLSLFNYAEFIVTNSFHGLAFSINFNKEFIVVKRNEFNSRIDSLLRLTKSESRQFDKNHFSIDILDKKIDYKSINQILEKERKKADKFIEKLGEYYEKN